MYITEILKFEKGETLLELGHDPSPGAYFWCVIQYVMGFLLFAGAACTWYKILQVTLDSWEFVDLSGVQEPCVVNYQL